MGVWSPCGGVNNGANCSNDWTVVHAMRVLLDVDGVLGDFPSEVLKFCNTYGDQAATLDEITDHDILKSLGCEYLQARLDQHMIDTDFCRHMPVYPGAQDFVARLSKHNEVVIVTARYRAVPNWASAREAWLAEHFGIEHRNVIFAKRKELVRGQILIDDKAENCAEFYNAGALAVCFDRPWNKAFRGWRAHSYQDVINLLARTR